MTEERPREALKIALRRAVLCAAFLGPSTAFMVRFSGGRSDEALSFGGVIALLGLGASVFSWLEDRSRPAAWTRRKLALVTLACLAFLYAMGMASLAEVAYVQGVLEGGFDLSAGFRGLGSFMDALGRTDIEAWALGAMLALPIVPLCAARAHGASIASQVGAVVATTFLKPVLEWTNVVEILMAPIWWWRLRAVGATHCFRSCYCQPRDWDVFAGLAASWALAALVYDLSGRKRSRLLPSRSRARAACDRLRAAMQELALECASVGEE